MYKKIYKNSVVPVLILMVGFIFSLVNIRIGTKASVNDVHLVLDSLKGYNDIPNNFRKTSDLSKIRDNKTINITGLDKLNISGSQQFSENNIPILVKGIGTNLSVTIVDLRQESHGFINGLPVSWANSNNNANEGLSLKQVLVDEAEKLKSIKLNVSISFYNKPAETIIPTKVQDEGELVKSKALGYSRITVKDGGIPTDDMVDYFVQFILSEPKNSWLHFRCKHGVGRTTTFMIMYDMMKNNKVASADDIIKRQLELSNIKDKDKESFYNDRRISFLKRFYDYCKINGDEFKVRWSDWIKSSSQSSLQLLNNNELINKTSCYYKNTVMSKSLYVISEDSMTSSEKIMVASLQGLVNSHCSCQIYTLNSLQPDYKIWLDDLKNKYNISCKEVSNPWQLIKIYKNYIEEYVLYSSKVSKDPSVNNACTLASLTEGLVINETIEAKIKSEGVKSFNGN